MTRYFHWDYETFPIAPAMQAPPIVVASYAWDDDAPRIVHANPAMNDHEPEWAGHPDPLAAVLLEALSDPEVHLVAHNASFETVCTMAYRPSWVTLIFDKLREGKVWCTQTIEKQIRKARGDRRDGYGLDDLAAQYKIPVVLDKSSYWRTRFGLLWETPISQFPAEALKYSLEDCCVREVFRAQRQRSRAAEWVDNARQQMADTALRLTSCNGFPTDGKAAQQLYDETVVKLEEYKQIVFEHGLARWERKKGVMVPVKTKAAAEARIIEAYAKMGREPPRGEPTEKMLEAAMAQGIPEEDVLGNYKLNEEACELSGDPVLLAYSKFGQSATLLKKVRRPLLAAELGVPVQCWYNVLVATGRTSCSQGGEPDPGEAWSSVGMQMQNLPQTGAEVEEDNG